MTLKLVGVDAHLFLNRRLVSLHQGEHIVLGRISKNLRTEFTAKSTNGYFDNPIISRRHALLENLWGEVYLTDQASTHGTFLNGVKLIPWVKRRVENGDCIALGCVLEGAGRRVEHKPSELEVGVVAMQGREGEEERVVRAMSTNSFHAPTDSDCEEDNPEVPLGPQSWRPFAPIGLQQNPLAVYNATETVEAPENVREVTSTPVTDKKPIDLPVEANPWVVTESIHVEHAQLDSDAEVETDSDAEVDYADSDSESQDDEGEDHKDERYNDFDVEDIYDYDTDDKASVNDDVVPETVQEVYYNLPLNPPTVPSPLTTLEHF